MARNNTTQYAQDLTLALGGHWYGSYGTAPCPVCQPEARPDQNALTLADGDKGLLAHCKKAGCDFREVAAALGAWPCTRSAPDPAVLVQRKAERRTQAIKRDLKARELWRAALPICGTPPETYLRGRGITCDLPATLRFHPECWHGPTARRLPALVALVEGGDGFAVHRTYLRPDGREKAPVAPAKAMLGGTAGGAVRLSGGHLRFVVGEGIESALSLLCGLLDGPATVWAALSTSGLRGLRLPSRSGRLTIACDGDTPGREAAHALAERAAGMGWRVGILDPGDGADFNDHLSERAA